MHYEYAGYLATLLEAPTPTETAAFDDLEAITISSDEMMRWNIEEQEKEREWERIPVRRIHTPHGLRLEGRFDEIHRLDIPARTLRFWVSLSTLGKDNPHFPLDTTRYPVIEITYRCTSRQVRPACLWTYPGGAHFSFLPLATEWRTVARRIPIHGFPRVIQAVTLRLYATTRTTEAIEIASIRFRAMSPKEEEACNRAEHQAEHIPPPKRHAVLDNFMPMGTFIDARTTQGLAEALGLSFGDYCRLIFEDVARHHHTCVAIEKADAFSARQMRTIFEYAGKYHVRIIPMLEFPLNASDETLQTFVEGQILAHREEPALFAWSLYHPPTERSFQRLLHTKHLIEKADPDHPVAFIALYSNAMPLFARQFSACGITHYAYHAPSGVVDTVREHLPLMRGQQFWAVTPGFVSPSDTPDWNGCPEMRLMTQLAFANGVRGWFTYTYLGDPPWVSGSCQRSLTGPWLTFSDLWAELSQRAYVFNALGPLFLNAEPGAKIPRWFGVEASSHAHTRLPDGMSPLSAYRLEGNDFSIYCLASNVLTEMVTVGIEIAMRGARGLEFYDMTDFLRDYLWAPMDRTRRLEMFPAQGRTILAAKPEICARWRDRVAEQRFLEDKRQFEIEFELLKNYTSSLHEIEAMAASAEEGDVLSRLRRMRTARDLLLDTVYETPSLCEPRSRLIEISAALAACDIALCASLASGNVERTVEMGRMAVPLAQELGRLRMELRHGHGSKIIAACDNLAKASVQTLSEIQAMRQKPGNRK